MTTTSATDVRARLGKHLLVDGYPLVLDLKKSRGTTLVDEATGDQYLDMFTFFASNALGMNHPGITENAEFKEQLLEAALNKPSNSDVYTVAMADFVDAFARVMGHDAIPHYFFIEGGSLAVENALKVAFDWKSRFNEMNGRSPELGTKAIHLKGAFHGRSGYTMSLTNTDPNKVARFPKFTDWPRISSPYIAVGRDMDATEKQTLEEAEKAFAEHGHDIACFIMETVQGEGGDHHFRPGFYQQMMDLVHSHDALFVLDEVQTGGGMTGKAWAFEHKGIEPDVVSFGKKLQVCGVMAGGRVDEVPDNVFKVSSRINSTWGGNLTDMVRCRRILEIIEEDKLMENAVTEGEHLVARLTDIAERHSTIAENPRGLGLMCALTIKDGETRDKAVTKLMEDHKIIMLGCGERSLRVRPPLTVSREDIDRACDAIDQVLGDLEK